MFVNLQENAVVIYCNYFVSVGLMVGNKAGLSGIADLLNPSTTDITVNYMFTTLNKDLVEVDIVVVEGIRVKLSIYY